MNALPRGNSILPCGSDSHVHYDNEVDCTTSNNRASTANTIITATARSNNDENINDKRKKKLLK